MALTQLYQLWMGEAVLISIMAGLVVCGHLFRVLVKLFIIGIR